MLEEELKKLYHSSKSKKDFLINANIAYIGVSGTKIDSELIKILSFMNVTKDDISAKSFKKRYLQYCIDEYEKNPKYCKYCGKRIEYLRSVKSDFCSEHCAKSYSNSKRKLSESTKTKIGNSVKQYKITNSSIRDKETHRLKELKRKCCICGKEFIVPIIKNDRYSKTKTCSSECKKLLLSNNSKISIKQRKENGTFTGWKVRNIESYAETFWRNVLDNNNIQYKREYYIDKYFLDFYIEKGNHFIDLEIDGKQHKYRDRILSDRKRDEILKSKNILVYRIEWNSINSEKGKKLMEEKINKFFDFIRLIS